VFMDVCAFSPTKSLRPCRSVTFGRICAVNCPKPSPYCLRVGYF
jgi:hypothetical protein